MHLVHWHETALLQPSGDLGVDRRPLGEWPGRRLARAVAVPSDKSPNHQQTCGARPIDGPLHRAEDAGMPLPPLVLLDVAAAKR